MAQDKHKSQSQQIFTWQLKISPSSPLDLLIGVLNTVVLPCGGYMIFHQFVHKSNRQMMTYQLSVSLMPWFFPVEVLWEAPAELRHSTGAGVPHVWMSVQKRWPPKARNGYHPLLAYPLMLSATTDTLEFNGCQWLLIKYMVLQTWISSARKLQESVITAQDFAYFT